jgi:hypothetical protein
LQTDVENFIKRAGILTVNYTEDFIITDAVVQRSSNITSALKLHALEKFAQAGLEPTRDLHADSVVILANHTDNPVIRVHQNVVNEMERVDSLVVNTRTAVISMNIADSQRQLEASGIFNIALTAGPALGQISARPGPVLLAFNRASALGLYAAGPQRLALGQGFAVTHILFSGAQGVIPVLANKIFVALGFDPAEADPQYSCVFYQPADGPAQGLPSRYSAANGTLAAQIDQGGAYYVAENRKTFKDIASKDTVMRNAIEILAAQNILDGYDDAYNPDDTITRAEIVKILLTSISRVSKTAQATFTDVHPSAWYAIYVGTAQQLRFGNGDEDNTFRPDRKMTAAEVITLFANVLNNFGGYHYPTAPASGYAGVPDWALPHLSLAAREGILTPGVYETGGLAREVTRGEIALMTYRLFNKL